MTAPGALLLSVAITLVCVPLKRTPGIPGWSIPYICLALGGIGFCLLEGWSFRNHLLGLIIGGCAVGLHQSIKQGRIGWRTFFEDVDGKEQFMDKERRAEQADEKRAEARTEKTP